MLFFNPRKTPPTKPDEIKNIKTYCTNIFCLKIIFLNKVVFLFVVCLLFYFYNDKIFLLSDIIKTRHSKIIYLQNKSTSQNEN